VGVCTPGVSLAIGAWRVDHMTLLRNLSSILTAPRASVMARPEHGQPSAWAAAALAEAAENAAFVSSWDSEFPKDGGHALRAQPEGELSLPHDSSKDALE